MIYILPFLPHLEIKGAKKHTPLPCEHISSHMHLITEHAILLESG
jgi:hypothetical protein